MNRRRFLVGATACGACLVSQQLGAQIPWQPPSRFTRPDLTTDEGGLWALMDREESRLRASPFVLRDPALRNYVQSIACRVAGEHCPDIRVHLVSTPLFNASMAPNGMMQVWTGLLLRMENEAQLAAILGHEIGHYMQRHTLERLRDVRSRSAFSQFLGLFGVAGAVAQLAVLASMFSYSREQEAEADQIGLVLMRKAGYDGREAGRIWENLLLEVKARKDSDTMNIPMFATHPAPEDRQKALQQLAAESDGGETGTDTWEKTIDTFRHEWIVDEVRRRQPDESLALLNRMVARVPVRAEYLYARGEVYRMRAGSGDIDAAISDYRAAIDAGREPPETHRSLGLIYRTRSQPAEAKASFERYLSAAPNAPDAAFIKAYLRELGS